MNALLPVITPASFDFFADLVVKATFLLLLAGVVGILLHRRSAATRHAVCALTVGALLLLPLLTTVSPEFRLAVLPSVTATSPGAAINTPDAPAETGRPAAESLSATFTPETPPPVAATFDSAPRTAPTTDPGRTAPIPAVSPLPRESQSPVSTSLDWRSGVVAVWLAGAGLFLAALLCGHLRAAHLIRRARRLPDQHPLAQQLARASQTLGVKRTVELRLTTRSHVPFTCGLWRATIVLPEEAEHWTADRVPTVLLHELAHVKRRDCLTQLLAQTCLAVYWFHPLVWLLNRRLRVTREKACDDLVLNAGVPSTHYGETLLSFALSRKSRIGAPFIALAMARKSSLETRLLAIMDTQLNRNSPSRAALTFGLIACAAAAITIASVRMTASETPPESAETPDQASAYDEAPVIRFSGRLEIRHETHGNLLHETPIAEITFLSGQSGSLSVAYDRGSSSLFYLEGELVDGSIELSGNVEVHQGGGFRANDPGSFLRLDRPFSATLSPLGGEQTIELGEDGEGRIVSLILTPKFLAYGERVEWLLQEIGRIMSQPLRLRPPDYTARVAPLLEHAKALHIAADGILPTERTRRLVDTIARFNERVVNDEPYEHQDFSNAIRPIGNALREDFEAWKAATHAAEDPFAGGARAEGARRSLFSPPVPLVGEPSPSHSEEATRSAETSDGLSEPVVEEQTMLRVTVLGEVNQPGVYELDPGSTILQALGYAGGWADRARLNQTVVQRDGQRYTVDVDAMLRGDGANVWEIKNGDVIYLQQRIF